MSKARLIFTLVAACLLAGYVVWSMCWVSGRRFNPECKGLTVRISDSRERRFVTADEIMQFLNREGVRLNGEPISYRRCHRVEENILKHPLVRTARCYPLPDGTVQLSLTQRIPVLRVLGADNYFVDSDRRVMQVRTTTASYVPVVTGRVPENLAKGQLFDFVTWLEDDAFWSAQVEQINIPAPGVVELIPRIGTGVIILGDLNGYQKKLRKLKNLYRDGFSKFGWKDYREIDLRFKGQVVCR